MASKAPEAFRTISEVADWLGVSAHVLRFWESKFSQVKPVKRAGGRRYYRPADMELLGGIRRLLHDEGMTVKGVQKMLREKGVKAVAALSHPVDQPVTGAPPAPTIFSAPAPSVTARASEAAPQAAPDPLPLFSQRRLPESLPGQDATPAQAEAEAEADASAPLHEETPLAEPPRVGVSVADPNAPSLADEYDGGQAAASRQEEHAATPGGTQGRTPVIAPLPGPEPALADRLLALMPGQIHPDRLRPIQARLLALRDRMDAAAAGR